MTWSAEIKQKFSPNYSLPGVVIGTIHDTPNCTRLTPSFRKDVRAVVIQWGSPKNIHWILDSRPILGFWPWSDRNQMYEMLTRGANKPFDLKAPCEIHIKQNLDS